MRFGRKKDDEPVEEAHGTALSSDPAEAGPLDPSTWALPADAGVTAAEGNTADIETVAPATAAGGLGRDEPTVAAPTPEPSTTVGGGSITSPGLGADAAPRAAAAANAPSPADPTPSPTGPATTPPRDTGALDRPASGGALAAILEHPTVKKRPEILVAGAFVGAFMVARILKRISE